jgi:hypothetical protein
MYAALNETLTVRLSGDRVGANWRHARGETVSEQNLCRLYDRIANDRQFRIRLRSDPEAALLECGLADDALVRSALLCIDWSHPDEVLSDQLLHPRVTK